MTVPPGQQCSLPGCDREAVDLQHPGALCRFHLEDDEPGEPVTEPEESGAETDCQESETDYSETSAVESGVFPEDLVRLANTLEDWQARSAAGETLRRFGRFARDVADAVIERAPLADLDAESARAAAGHPFEFDHCPVCAAELEFADGRQYCEGCEWTEGEDLYTAGDIEPAQILAWIDADPRSSDKSPALVRRRLPAPSELPDLPLVLDATATPEKIAALYGVDEDDVAVHGAGQHALENLRVTQILDGQYHHSTVANAVKEDRQTAAHIQAQLDRAGKLYDRPLIVGRREARELFDLPDNAKFVHYHGGCGLNFEECDAAVAVDAPHPDMEDVKRTARLLAQGRDDRVGGVEHSTRRDAPNPPVHRKLRYTDEDGRGCAVATKHYTGLVGALFREAREKELEQMLHRIRPLLADETVHAYLLTNVPTDLPVDEVCRLEELAEPAAAMLPITDGALELAETLSDIAAGQAPDGFRADHLVDDEVVLRAVNKELQESVSRLVVDPITQGQPVECF